ncbi:hypothetical protein ACIGW8_22150 [Streptomyces sioyaensis]|uniref:hypothetical protein n=1 Tax=Streptomyces sioyaensis TaxID=67364 RepID=UPI0037D37D6D
MIYLYLACYIALVSGALRAWDERRFVLAGLAGGLALYLSMTELLPLWAWVGGL